MTFGPWHERGEKIDILEGVLRLSSFTRGGRFDGPRPKCWPGHGQAMARAMVNAEELRKASDRRPQIRLMTQWGDYQDGVTVVALIAARTNAELEAQADLGVRHIPFAELDARAGELPDMVEAATAEIIAAVAAGPPPGPRPSTAEDLFVEAYEALEKDTSKAMFEAADELIRKASKSLSSAAAAEGCAAAALKVAALSAIAACIDLPDLTDMLKMTVSDYRRGQESVRPPGTSSH